MQMKLSDRRIKALTARKDFRLHGDGGNLGILISETSARWVFRFQSPVHHRQRDQGFGAYPAISLAKARALAALSRGLLDQGKDPLDHAKAAMAAAARKTFGQC